MANRTRPKTGRQSRSRTGRAASSAMRPEAARRGKSQARRVDVASTAAPAPLATAAAHEGAPPLDSCLRLGANLSIHEAGACLAQLRAALAGGLTEIDASALEAIDTAGMQLLLAAARAVQALGRRLRISHADKLLVATADALGLRAALAAVAELPT